MANDIHRSANAPQVLATLYFGANIASRDNEPVSQAQFDTFLEHHVTPHFPGFTVAYNQGYWKGEPEAVRVVTILAPDTSAFRAQIRQIAEQYKTAFEQEAGAYSFAPVEFTLDCWPYGPVKTYHQAGKGY